MKPSDRLRRPGKRPAAAAACTAFRRTSPMWAQVAPPSRNGSFRRLRRFARLWRFLASRDACRTNPTMPFRAMAADQVGLMHRLGFERFHVVGHDRGGRTAHRMALDHPSAVRTLAVLDIVPTYAMFMETNRIVAGAYWHWYFLSQPEPFPERMIGADPDFFYETASSAGARRGLRISTPEMLEDYRRSWRDPAMIHGSCSDYRAGATIDLDHDAGRSRPQGRCPAARLLWRERAHGESCSTSRPNGASAPANVREASAAGRAFLPRPRAARDGRGPDRIFAGSWLRCASRKSESPRRLRAS